jgi:osmotically-inducible protein OsmY
VDEAVRGVTNLINGTVRLRGAVRSLATRRIAQRAAESAPGVTRVENDLVVAP